MTKILVFLSLLSVVHFGSAETGCPEPEDILPCICTIAPFTYLECKEVDDAESLRNVFRNSNRYRYKEVHIEYSSLQYLPHDIFDTVEVDELYLKNVTLAQLFDSPPDALDTLQKLYIENTIVLRGIFWKLLEPLKSLRILTIYYNVIKSLSSDFSQYAPKELEQLSLYATQTKTLASGVFSEFPKLDKVEISACKLKELRRDIFPVPFNGRFLYFNDNNISVIPNDLFTQMPNLYSVGLRKNQIGSVPESAFESNIARIIYVRLEDNPLKCDCELVWMIKNKPEVLGGTCESPRRLQGRELKDLSPGDFNC